MKYITRLMVYVSIVLLINMQWGSPYAHAQSDTQAASVYWFDWSQDGTKVAVATVEGLSIYDSSFRLLIFRPQPDPTGSRPFASLSPDGTRLATQNEIWDTSTLQTLVHFDPSYELGEWSNNGKFIAALNPDIRGVAIFDTSTGSLLKTLSTGGLPITYSPIWSPDDMRIAANARGSGLLIFDVSKGEILALYPHDDFLGPITWSPDGTKLAYGGFAEVKPETPGSIPLTGSITGAVRNSVYIADASDGKILHMITGLPIFVTQILWSPDSTQLVASLGSKQVYIWDGISGLQIGQYDTPGGLVGIDYSPFGGQVMMGFNFNWLTSSPNGNLFTPQADFIRSSFGGAIQMAVPAPSLEKLQAITQACGTQPGVQQSLSAEITQNDLHTFTQQVTALTDAQIPPGCKADLLAVAEALTAQGS